MTPHFAHRLRHFARRLTMFAHLEFSTSFKNLHSCLYEKTTCTEIYLHKHPWNHDSSRRVWDMHGHNSRVYRWEPGWWHLERPFERHMRNRARYSRAWPRRSCRRVHPQEDVQAGRPTWRLHPPARSSSCSPLLSNRLAEITALSAGYRIQVGAAI